MCVRVCLLTFLRDLRFQNFWNPFDKHKLNKNNTALSLKNAVMRFVCALNKGAAVIKAFVCSENSNKCLIKVKHAALCLSRSIKTNEIVRSSCLCFK